MSQDIAQNYTHIKGWGTDADPKNEPTYPMKHYTGADHERLNWERPAQQHPSQEILMSTEHERMPAVFGETMPPSGLSGSVRRMAFHYSENRLRHWMPLVLADRINIVEGLIDDLRKGHIPNFMAEAGWKAQWKYDRTRLIKKVAIRAAMLTAVTILLTRNLRRGQDRD